ncbi:MAG TPA: hydroxysqualene dehydroxylase HpnE [Candidatus Angelobacter sp.]|nr:hydroxysqualene dehydroxylase HpnE [Candidatus Angelobacter sp.]
MASTVATVAIVGGGLAGLAAGCALSDAGFRVTLMERRPFVGGRASSYEHPGTGEVVDNCQHVLLGCCTNLIRFYEQLGIANDVEWFERLTFVEPGGRASTLVPTFLPAPMHSMPSFFATKSLSAGDKLAISRALMSIMMLGDHTPDSSQDFLDWLRKHGQTERAIERFWKVILVSALNEDLDRISVRYAVQVFRESFLKSAEAGKMGVPRVPLSDLYGNAAEHIREAGGEVLLRTSATSFQADSDGVSIGLNQGHRQFDYAILAVPFQLAAGLLPENAVAQPLRNELSRFDSSPITGIHLWFDRVITELPHAVLLDRTIQWMFQKSKFLQAREAKAGDSGRDSGSYIELVVSASRSLVEKSRQEVLDIALAELAEFFPRVAEARLVKAAVIKEIYATYSVVPGLDQHRPGARTAWPRLFLAGDWTATGWPATMEGAVRSGYLAAEALAESCGRPQTFLAPDLPSKGLMRLFR